MASANHGVPASDSSPELSTPPRSPDAADNVHVASYAPGASSVTTLPGGGSLTSFATNVTPTADRNGSAPPESGERKKRKYVRKAKEEKPPPPAPDATANGDTKAKKVRKPRAPRYARAPQPPCLPYHSSCHEACGSGSTAELAAAFALFLVDAAVRCIHAPATQPLLLPYTPC